MPPSLSTSVGGIKLSSCLYNASGPRSGTVEALKKVAASSGTGAVLSKSATISSQSGNPLPRVHHDEDQMHTWQRISRLAGNPLPRVHHDEDQMASYNSEGLPNQGIDYYIQADNVTEIMAPAPEKPYMVSLSGKTLDDNCVMLKRILDNPGTIAAIELNLACPNIIGKPTLAYDMEQLESVMSRITQDFKAYYSKNTKPVFGGMCNEWHDIGN